MSPPSVTNKMNTVQATENLDLDSEFTWLLSRGTHLVEFTLGSFIFFRWLFHGAVSIETIECSMAGGKCDNRA